MAPAPPPGYKQLAEHLRERIRAGQPAAGTSMPSLADVAARHGVARTTAYRAFQVLLAETLIEAVRGGRFRVTEPADFQQVVVGPGMRLAWRAATPEERDTLNLPVGAYVVEVVDADGWVDVYPAATTRIVTAADHPHVDGPDTTI